MDQNVWTPTALYLLDTAEIDSTGLERCWDAIRDEMQRIEREREQKREAEEHVCVGELPF